MNAMDVIDVGKELMMGIKWIKLILRMMCAGDEKGESDVGDEGENFDIGDEFCVRDEIPLRGIFSAKINVSQFLSDPGL